MQRSPTSTGSFGPYQYGVLSPTGDTSPQAGDKTFGAPYAAVPDLVEVSWSPRSSARGGSSRSSSGSPSMLPALSRRASRSPRTHRPAQLESPFNSCAPLKHRCCPPARGHLLSRPRVSAVRGNAAQRCRRCCRCHPRHPCSKPTGRSWSRPRSRGLTRRCHRLSKAWRERRR